MTAWSSCLLKKKQTIVPKKEDILYHDKYNPGDLVSADQFVVNTPGWLPTGYGQDSSFYNLHGGTLYIYAATGIIWVENQVSLGASETVLGKELFV